MSHLRKLHALRSATRPVVETLESRQLMTTVYYNDFDHPVVEPSGTNSWTGANPDSVGATVLPPSWSYYYDNPSVTKYFGTFGNETITLNLSDDNFVKGHSYALTADVYLLNGWEFSKSPPSQFDFQYKSPTSTQPTTISTTNSGNEWDGTSSYIFTTNQAGLNAARSDADAVYLDGAVLNQATSANSSCGYYQHDRIVGVSFEFDHTAIGTEAFLFCGSNLTQEENTPNSTPTMKQWKKDELWGIDNVKVIDITPVSCSIGALGGNNNAVPGFSGDTPFGSTTSVSTATSGDNGTGNGTRTDQPTLIEVGSSAVVLAGSGGTTYFDVSGSNFIPRDGSRLQLILDTSAQEYTLIDTDGTKTRFYGFGGNGSATYIPSELRGKVKSVTDAGGTVTSITYNTTGAAAGRAAQVVESRTRGTVTDKQTMNYAYLSSGANAGLLSRVTWQRAKWDTALAQTEVGQTEFVENVDYSYYTGDPSGTLSFGKAGNLRTAAVSEADKATSISTLTHNGVTITATSANHTLQAGDAVVINGVSIDAYNGTYIVTSISGSTFTYQVPADPGTSTPSGGTASKPFNVGYYRYYTSSTAPGRAGSVRFAFGPKAFARLSAFYSNPAANNAFSDITDATLRQFADAEYQYDSGGRTSRAVIAGEGCSTCSGGFGTKTYQYGTNPDADLHPSSVDYNFWRYRTVEVLADTTSDDSDNDRLITYSNEVGQPMLEAYSQVQAAKTVSGIARSSTDPTMVTATTSTSHGYSQGDKIAISGANQSQFNGVFTIISVNATTNSFTFTIESDPGFDATGTLKASKIGNQWLTFHTYDSAGREVLRAEPSAVTGYNELDNGGDLLLKVGLYYTYLADSTGLVTETTYGSSTNTHLTLQDAAIPVSGDVAGYFKQRSVRKGEIGSLVTQETADYWAWTAGGVTIYPLAHSTEYANTDGTGARKTTYGYGFAGSDTTGTMSDDTLEMLWRKTTLPPVETAHNGRASGPTDTTNSDTFTEYFDHNGRTIFTKDGDGYVNYTQYELSTGAVSKTIIDADTSITSDFVDSVPSGLSSPSGTRLRLATSYITDSQGRATKLTDPNGNITYTAYNDTSHEVRAYRGWNTSTNLPTGPTEVTREDWARGYTEHLTMSAVPSVSSGVPTGTEAVSSVQSLSRTYVNSAGQTILQDNYDSLPNGYSVSHPYSPEVLADSPIGYWRLDETSGTTAYDSSGNGRNGTYSGTDYALGAIGAITGDPDRGLTFGGSTNSSVSVAHHSSLAITGNITIVEWVKVADRDGHYGIVSKTSNNLPASFDFYIQQTTGLPVLYRGNGQPGVYASVTASSAVPADDQWHMVAVTMSGTTVTHYLDGVANGTGTLSTTVADAGTSLKIGNRNDGNTPMDGDIDEVALFNTALSADRIAAYYGAGRGLPRGISRTAYEYDQRGRIKRVKSPTGTITRTLYDGLGRVISSWIGTNDAGATNTDPTGGGTTGNNMKKVREYQYDKGGVGDGNLTKVLDHPTGALDTSNDRATRMEYDWRDRLIITKQGAKLDSSGNDNSAGESTSTNRLLTYNELDNLDRVTAVTLYDADQVSLGSATNGVPDKPTATLARARSTTEYDEQGRVFRASTFSVDGSGNISTSSLHTDTWYDRRGNVAKSSQPGGLVTKTQYDGAGRPVKVFVSDAGSDTTYSHALDVVGDTVLEQRETQYDAAGNPILVTSRQRFHDATATGELGDPSSTGSVAKARRGYQAFYYDKANRLTDQVSVGTNAASAYTRPGSVPSRSDTVLVTSYSYDSAGRVQDTTDPRGIVTRTAYDMLGRTTQVTEAYTDGSPSAADDRITQYTYDGVGHILTMKAVLPSSTFQTTQYVYGVTTSAGSDIASNDLLLEVRYPDKTSGSPGTASTDKQTFKYNALSQTKEMTDQNGTTHQLSYDVLGRQTEDYASTLASGIDSTVRRHRTSYGSNGQVSQVASLDNAGTTTLNSISYTYNGLGQVTQQTIARSGATSRNISYTYSEMSGGANHSRLIRVTYPNGRYLHYGYNTGIDGSISRVSFLADDNVSGSIGTHLEEYSYLGLGTIIERNRPQPGTKMTYVKQGAESNGSAGDQYAGLDRFGRIADQRWLTTSTTTDIDRYKYAYDRDSNRLFKENTLSSANSELYHADGATAGYDLLNRLSEFQRGTLSDANSDGVYDTVSSASRTQTWSLDALGNWDGTNGVVTDGTSQSRSHDKRNELMVMGGNTLAYDSAGNQTTDERAWTFTYDAWGKLIQVKDNTATVKVTYSYDALGERITETIGSTTKERFYNTGWQMLEERTAGVSTAITQFVWGQGFIDALVLTDRDADENIGTGTLGRSDPNQPATGLEQRIYAQQDGNWNVTSITSSSGGVVEFYRYDSYGAVTVLDATWSPRIVNASSYGQVNLFQGGRLETASGLYTFRNRDYSASQGRWTRADPAGYVDGMNGYGYLRNNSVTHTDSFGLQSNPNTGVSHNGGLPLKYHSVTAAAQSAKWKQTVDWLKQNLGNGQIKGCKCSCNAIKAGIASIFNEMMRDPGLFGNWADNRSLQIYLEEGRDTGQSLGPGQIKIEFIQGLVDDGLLNGFFGGIQNGTQAHRDKVSDMLLNNPVAVACTAMQKVIDQWETARANDASIADIRGRVDILATLYNIGLGKSIPKPNPQPGGKSWPAYDSQVRTFGENAQLFSQSQAMTDLLNSIGCEGGKEYPH